jgi:hypothetical protein
VTQSVNGPQHYLRAEELLNQIKGRPQAPTIDNGAPLDHRQLANLIARADVHARLAQVAALAQGFSSGKGMTAIESEMWNLALEAGVGNDR